MWDPSNPHQNRDVLRYSYQIGRLRESQHSILPMVHFLPVDYGTTKVSVSRLYNGHAEVMQLNGDDEMPSAIYIRDDIVLYGKKACLAGVKDPVNLFTGLKTLVGKTFKDEEFEELKSRVRFRVDRDKDNKCVVLVQQNGGIVPKYPVELISMLLSHVIDVVKSEHHIPVDGVIMSYPPSFLETQIRELYDALTIERINHVDLVAETTAGCYFSGIIPTEEHRIVLVIDCGGGTTDFSIIDVGDDVYDVKYTYGLPAIGGENFTAALEKKVYNDLRLGGTDVSSFSLRKQNELHNMLEEIKRSFSSSTSSKEFYYADDDSTAPYTVTATGLKVACRELVNACCEALNYVLEEAKKNQWAISACVFAGGGLELGCLRERFCRILNLNSIHQTCKEAVVCGLVHAARKVAESHHDGDRCSTRGGGGARAQNRSLHEVDFSLPDLAAIPEPSMEPYMHDVESMLDAVHPSMAFHAVAGAADEAWTQPEENVFPPPPTIPIIRPDDELLLNNAYAIKEKRAYNVYLKVKRGVNGDLKMVVSKKESLPFDGRQCELLVSKNSDIHYYLYEGVKPKSSQCNLVRDIMYARDEKHPSTENARILYRASVDKNGFISFVTWWKDTGEELKVVHDRRITKSSRKKQARVEENAATPTSRGASARTDDSSEEAASDGNPGEAAVSNDRPSGQGIHTPSIATRRNGARRVFRPIPQPIANSVYYEEPDLE